MEAFKSHPRLIVGAACLALIVLWNLFSLIAGSGDEPARGKPPPLTQHDRDFVIALYDLTNSDLTNPDRVAAILKTQFKVSHSEGEDRDTECSDGRRQTDIDTYTPSRDFWSTWIRKTHEDALLEAASGIDKSDRISDPQFTYTVIRPRPCSGAYASAPVTWGFVRFLTAPAFSCLTETELQRAFPKLAKDSWSTGTITTYRAVNSPGDQAGTTLIASDAGTTCLSAISVAGGEIWGRSYRAAEARYLQCEAGIRTAFSQQYPEPRQDRSSLAAAHDSAPAHAAWEARQGSAVHQTCGGEPYFPDLLTP